MTNRSPICRRHSARLARRILALLALAAISVAGCTSEDDSASTGADAASHPDAGVGGADGASGDDLTWYGAIEPIVEERCAGCHTPGGAGPFALDSPEDWETWGPSAMAAIEAERMPPWMPDRACREYAHERHMPPGERATLAAWLDGDRTLGSPDAAPAREAPEAPAFEPNIEAPMGVTYTPTFGSSDDYRCFILGVAFDEDIYMTGSNVRPGNGLVHHVLVYALEGDAAQTARALEDEEDGPGYTCFGGPIPLVADDTSGGPSGLTPEAIADRLAGFGGFPNQIAAWVPGSQPSIAPEGMANRIAAGSLIVMQVHYSAVAGESVADDSTTLLLETTTEEPTFLRSTRAIAIRDLHIPSGESDAEHELTVRYWGEGTFNIQGLTAHMHLLGTRFRTDVVRSGGSTECGLDIPDWDFNWQQMYRLPDDDPIVLEAGDGLNLTCAYDNSQANQPVVNGEQIAPRDVTWGDGTLDEMCLLYIDSFRPFEPAEGEGAAACPSRCETECPDGDSLECTLNCTGDDIDCFGCSLGALFDCGGTACAAALFANQECFTSCATSSIMLGSNIGTCLAQECPAALESMAECVDPLLQTDECATAMRECGL